MVSMATVYPTSNSTDVMPIMLRIMCLKNNLFWSAPSMDDVQVLLESAKQESYLFVVDSRRRDTSVHPSPSEYVVTFSAPFRNVFGLDLLDATVARTEYIVDTTTNTLEYVMSQPGSLTEWNQGAWVSTVPKRTIRLDPGDYNLPQLVEHMNDKLAAKAAEVGEAPIRCAPVTNPSEVSNKIRFTCSTAFTFLMDTSSIRHTIGFGDPVHGSSVDYGTVPGWSVNLTGGASDTFLSVPATVLDGDPQTATLGPVPAGPKVQYEDVYSGRNVRQYFVSQASGPATVLMVYAFGKSGCPGLTVRIVRSSDGAVMSEGSIAGSDLSGSGSDDAYDPLSCDLVPTSSTSVLETGAAYYVSFTCVGTSQQAASVYYNEDNVPVSGQRYIVVSTGSGNDTVHLGSNVCCDVALASWGHAIQSPGLVNLTGPRYVNIRCPEIESHMFRDRVNEACHAGLGMVKLRGYGFRDQRFDFVSFPSRTFHPIGRLSRLTFRLERPDGTLYESHGVDHTLLLVLRYYSLPRMAPQQHQSVLNPDYVPDLRRYMIEHKWPLEAEATDRISTRY